MSNPIGTLSWIGERLRRHPRAIASAQQLTLAVYLVLLVVPVLPEPSAHAAPTWEHIATTARFVFWGLWWPTVILSVMLAGRLWCGLLCPDGTLTEFASRHGRARKIPGLLR
jgi:hypothetical protein